MIYRLVVVNGQRLTIQTMHLQDFEKSQDSGAYRSRSTYVATDHECHIPAEPGEWPAGSIRSCLVKHIRFGPCMKTTYTIDTPESYHTTTTTMLSLNKESREEVASIFYGENTFHFTAMSSLMPFMKDRTVETRKYIRSLWLTLTVDHRDWDAILTEYSRPASWNTAFSSLLKLPNVEIKQLYVQLDDTESEILRDGLNLRSRSMLWLHKLSKLENLEMLGVRYDIRQWKISWCWGRSHTFKPYHTVEQDNSQTEQELWRVLAPKMLKKEADDHTPDALQKRRIWDWSDTFTSVDTYTDLTLLGDFGSSSDSDSDDE